MTRESDHHPIGAPWGATTTRIAVIVPTHNDGELAQGAVESVMGEPNVEVIVVDDGSTDPASVAAISALERDGIRVLRQPGRGPGPARLAGAHATSAPLLFPLDADDMIEPGALAALAAALERHPEAAFAWGDYHEFGGKDERYRAPHSFMPWSTTYLNLYSPAILIRRDALLAAGGWPASLYEDWSLLLGLIEQGCSGVYVEQVTYHRRITQGRRLADARREHSAAFGELRRRHPRAFSQRARLARIERPPLWKRVVYPLVYGPRTLIPPSFEERLRSSCLWTHLRPLRR
jgi:glycosyltransferase involved in cell wall biosynthesis